MLWSLIHWVEKGQTPTRLTATKIEEGRERFTRTLGPYPQAARWDRKGPTEAASSYRCAVDPALVRYMSRRSLVGS